MKLKNILLVMITAAVVPSLSYAETVKNLTAAQAIKEISAFFNNKAELKGVLSNQPCYITAVNLESFIGGLEVSIRSQNQKYFSSVALMGNQRVIQKRTSVYHTNTSSMYMISNNGDSSFIDIAVYTNGANKGLITVTLSPTDDSDMIGMTCRLAQ